MDRPTKHKQHSRWETPRDDGDTITARDAAILQLFFENGPTRTGVIQKLFFPGKDKRACVRRLMHLARRRQLFKPHQQRERENANYVDLIYDISPMGCKTLLDRDVISASQQEWYRRLHTRGRYLNFWHQVFGAEVMASVRIGLSTRPHVSFFSVYDILASAPATTQGKKNPLTVDLPNGEKLTPDDFFGLRFAKAGTPLQFMFFAREDDLATEPVRRIRSTGSSFHEKLLKYRTAITGGLFQTHFGITAPVVVLTATTSKRHLDSILFQLEPMKGQWREHLAFQATPSLNPFERPEMIACVRCSGNGAVGGKTCHRCKGRLKTCKPPDDHMLSRPYRRVGFPEFNLADPS